MASKEVWESLFLALDSLMEEEFDQTLEESGFDSLPIALPVSVNLRVPFSELFALRTLVSVSLDGFIPAQKKKSPISSFGASNVVFASNKSSEAA